MDQTLTLPDGRTLGYAITGDPAGAPAFYFHGWPASRLEGGLIADLPVRLISPDRPGYGNSTAQRRRRLLDWPADVAALAAHLGVERFHVVGVSGGAPYALACAARLPGVVAAALISPLPPLAPGRAPPPEALGEGLGRLQRLGLHPRIGRLVMGSMRLAVGWGLFNPQKVLDDAGAPSDAACLSPDLRRRLIGAWREGLKHGVAGAVSDARIYASDWGFDLAAIPVPVAIWHGTADEVVPIATLSAYAALPAERHILDGEGHYSLALTRTAEVLAALMAEAGAQT